ncbi:MAG: beta-propeller fold lactonase family protein, partial [Marinosulfonomonas sp.]|nr:beta-propeller fold lactonase family protein [Marinosulfonomonas sp.]
MVTITHTQTLWAADISELGQSARISISGDETNPTLVISDPNTGRILTTSLTNAPIDYSSFQIQSLSSDQGLSQIDLNGRSKALDTATIMRAGEDATSEMTFLGRSGFIGDATHVLVINLGGIDYLYATDRVAGGVSVHQVDALGNLTSLSSVVDTAADKLAGISSLASIETGAGIFVVAASQTENALNLFQVGTDGQLNLVDSISTDDLLPIDRPTDLATVTLSGTDYVLMTSYGSSSLTVFELTPAGELRFVTQANDALGTRFSGAMTLDTITLDGQVFVAVGGNDGGLTLFQLLPNGQLLLLATLVDTTETALENIEQLEFVVVDGQVELWAYTTGDAGLTRLNIDFGEIG